MKLTEITLDTLAGGAAEEKFQHEWGRVLANVQDVNTKAGKPRTVVLTVVLHPDEDREGGQVEVSAAAKLAPHMSTSSQVFLGRKDGQLVAAHYDPRQGDIFGDDEEVGVDENIHPIDSRTGTEGGT